MRHRYLLAFGIAIMSGCLCYLIRLRNGDVGDFTWALYSARAMLDGRDPYAFTPDAGNIPYPLPVALFGIPLIGFPWAIAASIFVGLSSGVLALGIARSATPWRLYVFLTLPYFWALHFTQWSPLIMAAWFYPWLAPLLALVKPQIALPVVVLRRSKRGLLLAACVALGSLVVDATWPLRWSAMIGHYTRTVPILTLPFGPLLLLAALRIRDDRARLLLMLACLPVRATYDLMLLWLLPATQRQALLLTVASWVGVFWFTATPPTIDYAIPLLFIPCLCWILWPVSLFKKQAIESPSAST